MRQRAAGGDRAWWVALGVSLSLAVAVVLVACGGGQRAAVTGASETVAAGVEAQHSEDLADHSESPPPPPAEPEPICETGTPTATAQINGTVTNSTIINKSTAQKIEECGLNGTDIVIDLNSNDAQQQN